MTRNSGNWISTNPAITNDDNLCSQAAGRIKHNDCEHGKGPTGGATFET